MYNLEKAKIDVDARDKIDYHSIKIVQCRYSFNWNALYLSKYSLLLLVVTGII